MIVSRPKPKKKLTEQQRLRQIALRRSLEKQLIVVSVVAGLGAGLAAVLMNWDRLFPLDEQKRVAVYWTHGCDCVYGWIRQLKSEGFDVVDFEPETLGPIRKSLHTPPTLRGCHVARYMNYFVEGHVPPWTLREIATAHPDAAGISMVADTEKSYALGEGSDEVLLIKDNGASVPWIRESGAKN